MSAKPAILSDAAMMALLTPLLLPDETVTLMANGVFAPLEYHDALTQFFLRLRGKWQAMPFIFALTGRHLRWLEIGPAGGVTVQQAYRLPLKGRLVLQKRGVIEFLMPGEPRRFLTFAVPERSHDLYRAIDDQQLALQRAHAHVPEVVGVGTKPALANKPFEINDKGETTVLQHEMVDEIRSSFRPGQS
ncbi:MAG: hypothetical protein H7338_22160 [Candidatus Sericytochromatia bacterium]|nr:hypothetical protein [Candidatus Sericytochromatia bacterium]